MKASLDNPIYTVYIQCGSYKYKLHPVVQSLDFSDQEKQMSQSVQITLMDIQTNGDRLSHIIKVCDPVWIYADDGEQKDEVWRGIVWSRNYKHGTDGKLLTLKCYDNLIYFQESEESEFFSSGKSTESICRSLCDKWGVPLEYGYTSITHSKLALRGTLSNIFTDDVLDTVKKQTGKKYVIRSEKGVMHIRQVGSNTKVYDIDGKKNAIKYNGEWTMDGVTTKVVILGKADDDDRRPVEATVKGDTVSYGTLQKVINRSENTSLADAKAEAQSIISENGKPWWEFTITAPDIPWIRKGDKIHVDAGELDEYFIVKGIDREITNKSKKMTLTFEF